MDRVLTGENLPGALSLSDKGISQSKYGIKASTDPTVLRRDLSRRGLFVTFGEENFVKRPAVLLTEGKQNLRLDGLLTLIAIAHGKLGELKIVTRYAEQMRENVKKFDMKRSTDSRNKILDLRHTLIQYLLQQIALEPEKTRR